MDYRRGEMEAWALFGCFRDGPLNMIWIITPRHLHGMDDKLP